MPLDEMVTPSETKLTLGQICQQLAGNQFPDTAAPAGCPCNQMGNSPSVDPTYNVNSVGCTLEATGCSYQPGNAGTNDSAPAWSPLPCWNPSPWHNTSPLKNAFTCFKAVHLWNSTTNEETTPRELTAFSDESNTINCSGNETIYQNAINSNGNEAMYQNAINSNGNETLYQNANTLDGDSKILGVFMPRFSLLPIISSFLAGSDNNNTQYEYKVETTCDVTSECNDNLTCPIYRKPQACSTACPEAPTYSTKCREAPKGCLPRCDETPSPSPTWPPAFDEEPGCSTMPNKLNVQNCCWGSCYPNYCGSCCYGSCDPCWPRTAICGNTSPCFSTTPWCQKMPCWNTTPWCYNNPCCNQCRW